MGIRPPLRLILILDSISTIRPNKCRVKVGDPSIVIFVQVRCHLQMMEKCA
jgi:hypothetical protein